MGNTHDHPSEHSYSPQRTPMHTLRSRRAAQEDREFSALVLDGHISNAHSDTKTIKSPSTQKSQPPTSERGFSWQQKARKKITDILEPLIRCARASGQWSQGRARSAKAVLSSTLFQPLRFAFNWLATVLIIMLVVLISSIILFTLLKLVACQFPGVKWLLWISGNSCSTIISSLLPLELLSSIAHKGCHLPGMSVILYKYGVKCHGLTVSDMNKSRDSVLVNPVHMIVNSSEGITLLQQPAMDLYDLAQGLGESRIAIFDAGVKIYLTSLADSTQVAQDHYSFSQTIDQHKEELEDFYSRLTIFMRFLPIYLVSAEKRIQAAQLQQKLSWYHFSNSRHSDVQLTKDLDRYFNFMEDELEILIPMGEVALDHLKGDDVVWERLEKWRTRHVKDIQGQLFKPRTLQEWWLPQERQHQKHNLEILVEVHRSHYSPMRVRMDEILVLLRTTLIKMKNAQRYIKSDILAGRGFERASAAELVEWSKAVRGLSATMSDFKEAHRRVPSRQ